MAAPVTCHKCKKTSVDVKDTIQCCKCKNRYEFDCAGYSSKLYKLRTEDSKKDWICKLCLIKKDSKMRSGPSNITYRKVNKGNLNKNTTPESSSQFMSNTSNEFLAIDSSLPPEDPQTVPASSSPANSLVNSPVLDPDLLVNTNVNEINEESLVDRYEIRYIEDSESFLHTQNTSPNCSDLSSKDSSYDSLSLQGKLLSKSVDGTILGANSQPPLQETNKKISELELALASTQNELENKIIENIELQKKVDKLTIETEVLQSLCHIQHIEPKNSTSTGKKNRLSSLLHKTSTPGTPRASVYTDNQSHINKNIFQLQIKIIETGKLVENMGIQLTELKKQMKSLTESLRTPPPAPAASTASPTELTTSNKSKEIKYQSVKTRERVGTGPKIMIYGTQQCVGLASSLVSSRKQHNYIKYEVTAITKPNSLSAEITKNCLAARLKPEDKLVICFGENDRGIQNIISLLRIILDKFVKHAVLVLSVKNNIHVDTVKLNLAIKKICTEYKNSHYIDCSYKNRHNMSKLINYCIDCIDYENNYLNINELKKKMLYNGLGQSKNAATLSVFKKGTIPYCFARARSRPAENADFHSAVTSIHGSIDNNKSKKATLTDYFPLISKKDFFRR